MADVSFTPRDFKLASVQPTLLYSASLSSVSPKTIIHYDSDETRIFLGCPTSVSRSSCSQTGCGVEGAPYREA